MRVIQWCAVLACGVGCGLTFGVCTGFALAALSGDYVVVPADYISEGWRAGLVMWASLAATHLLMGTLPRFATSVGTIAVSLVVAAGTLGLVLLFAMVWSLLPGSGTLHANLGHPRRYGLFLAGHTGWLYSLAIGWAAALYAIHIRPRTGKPGSPTAHVQS